MTGRPGRRGVTPTACVGTQPKPFAPDGRGMAKPTAGQRRLMYGLFAVAMLITLLGILAVVVLSGVL